MSIYDGETGTFKVTTVTLGDGSTHTVEIAPPAHDWESEVLVARVDGAVVAHVTVEVIDRGLWIEQPGIVGAVGWRASSDRAAMEWIAAQSASNHDDADAASEEALLTLAIDAVVAERIAQHSAREAARLRDVSIRAAIAGGVSVREIARQSGLTAGRISQIAAA